MDNVQSCNKRRIIAAGSRKHSSSKCVQWKIVDEILHYAMKSLSVEAIIGLGNANDTHTLLIAHNVLEIKKHIEMGDFCQPIPLAYY